jgi:uncharacterized protein YecT (DUF1311 family)
VRTGAGRRLIRGCAAAALSLCAGCIAPPAQPQAASGPTSGPTMVQTQQSAAEQLAADQHKLQALLGELEPALAAPSARELDGNQAQWDALARRECSWQRELSGGGSMSSLVYATCLDQRVKQRIDWLKLFLCEGYGSTGACAASNRY